MLYVGRMLQKEVWSYIVGAFLCVWKLLKFVALNGGQRNVRDGCII